MSALVADEDLDRKKDDIVPKGRSRRILRRLVFVIAGAAILATAFSYTRDWWLNGRFIEATDDAYVGGNSTPVAPHVSGFIAEVAVTDNQHVSAGQLLVRLDDRDTRAALDHAVAVRKQRQAALEALKARLVLQDAVIRQAAAELDAKSAQAAFARSDAARYNNLVNTPAVTRQEVERSLSLSKAAVATVSSAEATLDGAKRQRSVLDAQVAEAQGSVAQADADVEISRLNLGYTEIRSPIDGFIGNRAAREGAYVAVGAYLMTIVPSQGLWVDANFKEDQLRHMRAGSMATVTLDVASDEPLHGHVASLAPGTGAVFSIIPPENATGNFTKIVQRVPVRIVLEDRDAALGRLRPGLSATVDVDTRSGESKP